MNVYCDRCDGEMNTVDGCAVDRRIYIDGDVYEPVRYGDEWKDVSERCGDCGAKEGYYHHPGCDVERCPKCETQYLTCGCNTAEKRAVGWA